MPLTHPRPGALALAAPLRAARPLLGLVALFSLCVNLLMLAGPLYMLNVYDSVLGAGSVETLVALTGLVAFLYTGLAVIDAARQRVMARVAARVQSDLDAPVFARALSARLTHPRQSASALHDLEVLRGTLSGGAMLALFDLPWSVLYFIGIYVFHPSLALLGVVGAAVLLGLAVLSQQLSGALHHQGLSQGATAGLIGQQIQQETETVHALGLRAVMFARWNATRSRALRATLAGSDVAGAFSTTIRAMRLMLQSAMLGLGAWLTLRGTLTPGAMIAASILLGRGLAPIETLVGQWPVLMRAQAAWRNLTQLLEAPLPAPPRTVLPEPDAHLSVSGLSLRPPLAEGLALRDLSFTLKPGQALGVIGPSGAGKSTLGRALAGIWPPQQGTIRLAGAPIDQYDSDRYGRFVGYLPQRPSLFDGSLAENIARMNPEPPSEQVIEAAQAAGVHDMILTLPEGYDTWIPAASPPLSGGQVQRICLARAFYGAPRLLILDEPNSSLDALGNMALNRAIATAKAAGAVVVVMAHRPSAIEGCDLLMVLERGQCAAFGPRAEVLRAMVSNHDRLRPGGRP